MLGERVSNLEALCSIDREVLNLGVAGLAQGLTARAAGTSSPTCWRGSEQSGDRRTYCVMTLVAQTPFWGRLQADRGSELDSKYHAPDTGGGPIPVESIAEAWSYKDEA